MKKILLISLLLIVACLYGNDQVNKYLGERFPDKDGNIIEELIIPGGRPPVGYIPNQGVDLEQLKNQRNVFIIDDVPAYSWSYGCSATAAAMMAAYYDRHGYSEMYEGSTNGGVMPLDNAIWGASGGGEGSNGECPLSATNQGIDGRVQRGHVDDYWVAYGSSENDPYPTYSDNSHTQADCTGDFMGTNQSYWNNSDGSTRFYNYGEGYPLSDFSGEENAEVKKKDGTRGLRQFFEHRGYDVLQNFNQYIYNSESAVNGFTFENYKEEIDANRPVLIHLAGHTMLGIGYDDSTNEIYINNTWDYSTHTMTWGGVYEDMQHLSVSVIELEPVPLNAESVEIITNGSLTELTWEDVTQSSIGNELSGVSVEYRVEWSDDVNFENILGSATTYQSHYNHTNGASKLFYRVYTIIPD